MQHRARLPALTGIRFLAALWVAMGHYLGWHAAVLAAYPAVIRGSLRTFTTTGSDAVSFFFVLSGFVLTYSYVDSAGLIGSRRSFYVARIARIYPAYLAAFVIAALPYVWVYGTSNLPSTGAAALTMTQSWWPWALIGQQWNGPAWSVSTEMGFYLLFPLIAVLLVRRTRRSLLYLIGACWAITTLLPSVDTTLLRDGYWHSMADYWAGWNAIQGSPIGRLPEFLIGCCAGRLFLQSRPRAPSPRRTDVLSLAVLTAIVLGVAVEYTRLPDDVRHHGLLAPLFALLIALQARNTGRFCNALSRPTLVLLGDASYALYLFHQPVWAWLDRLGTIAPTSASAAMVVTVGSIGLVAALSLLSMRLVEQPARRAILRLARRPTPERAPGNADQDWRQSTPDPPLVVP